ncbi:hypothetical protein J2S43_005714 [Catenuloplanes nepalensis]|uniref:Integral membrane protein n=1 Tax=Catenuloplanes nepalensis TaxID=587533 RepID=A0ABT9N0I2_9ACTN|nr:hypothetical protein [Catenuloplanes nepalensis]MDP9797202.1 hypothetical protein [Catenuloplanes nepalensis]
MNRHPGVLAVLIRRLLGRMGLMVSFYWAILITVYLVVAVSVGLFDTLDTSMWLNVGGAPPRYWLLSMGTVTVLGGRVYVAMGVTRHQLAEAYLVLFALMALLFGVVQVAGHLPEYAVYAATGTLSGLTEPYPVTGAGDAVRTLLTGTVLNLVYLAAGALIGIGFYRYRFWGGLAIVPVAALAPVAAEAALDIQWTGKGVNNLLDLPPATLPAGLAIAAAVLVLTLAVTYRMYRTTPIRPASAR